MSTKAGRVTMKDVRQGKTFWKVVVRHLLMPNEYTRVEEEIIDYAWPVRVRVDMKISIEGVQNKMGGFVYSRLFRYGKDISSCNLEDYQGRYRRQDINLEEFFVSRKAAMRFIKLNQNAMLTQKDKNQFERNRHSRGMMRGMMEADCREYDSLWISEKP